MGANARSLKSLLGEYFKTPVDMAIVVGRMTALVCGPKPLYELIASSAKFGEHTKGRTIESTEEWPMLQHPCIHKKDAYGIAEFAPKSGIGFEEYEGSIIVFINTDEYQH